MTKVFEINGIAPSFLDLASTLENLEARKILEKKVNFGLCLLVPGTFSKWNGHSLAIVLADNLLSIFLLFQDSELTKEEIIAKHDVFVGSQATDFGEALTRHDEF